MVDGFDFETVLKLKGKGEMDRAEDWISANIKGLWALEFIGMLEEHNEDTGTRQSVLHVRFKFGRKEDYARFKNEYIDGKPPVQSPAAKPKAPPKKKGLFGFLFD